MNDSFFEKNKKLIFVGLFFLAIFFLGNIFLLFFNKNQNLKSNVKNDVIIEKQTVKKNDLETVGQINLKADKEIFFLNEEVKVNVYASSENNDILAYDLVVVYDKEGLQIIKYQSENNNFDVFATKDEENGKIFLTFGKKLQSKESITFKDDKVASFVFKPKKRGNFFVRIVDKFNKETTKFVDINNNIFYPKTNEVHVNIQ